MFGLGMPEIVIVLIIALIVFGPGKLPDIGKAIGKGIRDFKKEMDAPEQKTENTTKTGKIEDQSHIELQTKD